MPLTYIQRPKGGSDGAMKLARLLGVKSYKRIAKRGPHNVIVWGCREPLDGPRLKVLNNHEAVRIASDKVMCLSRCKAAHIPTVDWTCEHASALKWSQEGKVVIARRLINASGGAGIMIVKPGDAMPHCPLYTLFSPSTSEWRVHISMKKEEALFAKKAKRNGQEEADIPLRNHGDTYTFKYHDVAENDLVRTVAINAVRACGLDFGAVDVLYDKRLKQARLLEINTAPGLDHEVPLMWYTTRFQEWINEQA